MTQNTQGLAIFYNKIASEASIYKHTETLKSETFDP